MSMKVIALTSANEAAMQSVATQLLQAATAGQLRLSVMVGIKTADEAQAIFHGQGELWRVGEDDSKPELDALVDRAIDDSAPARMAAETAQALRRFVTRADLAGMRAARAGGHQATGMQA
jgi:hypothetical protein